MPIHADSHPADFRKVSRVTTKAEISCGYAMTKRRGHSAWLPGRRLALGSRTTLYEPTRLAKIKAATSRQKQEVVRDMGFLRPESDDRSQSDVARLRHQLNELRSYVARIAINSNRIGLQPEMLLSVAQQATDTDGALNANLLVMGYLSGIGLLAKLDANVRGPAR